MPVTHLLPATAQAHVASGSALLVCAYDDEDKCARNKLASSISLNALKGRLSTLPVDQELIFYCA